MSADANHYNLQNVEYQRLLPSSHQDLSHQDHQVLQS